MRAAMRICEIGSLRTGNWRMTERPRHCSRRPTSVSYSVYLHFLDRFMRLSGTYSTMEGSLRFGPNAIRQSG